MRLKVKTRAMFKGRLFELIKYEDYFTVVIRNKNFLLLNSSWNFNMHITHLSIFESLDALYYVNAGTNIVEDVPHYVNSETLYVEYVYGIRTTKAMKFAPTCIVTINGVEAIVNRACIMSYNSKYFNYNNK